MRIAHFTAKPTKPGALTPSDAFVISKDGSATAGQPDGAHYVFPSNDHPRDKATYAFHFDVPSSVTAVANGAYAGKYTRNNRTAGPT